MFICRVNDCRSYNEYAWYLCICSDKQIEGWEKLTDVVHSKNVRIVLQIWHGGRDCLPDLNDGKVAIAPSTIAIKVKHILQVDLEDTLLHLLLQMKKSQIL